MSIQRVRRMIRDLSLAVHMAIHIAVSVSASAKRDWRDGHRYLALAKLQGKLIRWLWSESVVRFDWFPVDGDEEGRRHSRLTPDQRRQRRQLARARRLHVTELLAALGDTAEQVEQSLTAHWLTDGECGELWRGDPVTHYLADCLRSRDGHALILLEVHDWAIQAGGTWVATPKPVRQYLARRGYAHWKELEIQPSLFATC